MYKRYVFAEMLDPDPYQNFDHGPGCGSLPIGFDFGGKK